jgi:hypothetical protein
VQSKTRQAKAIINEVACFAHVAQQAQAKRFGRIADHAVGSEFFRHLEAFALT